jgi:hypothetical protein
MARCRRAPDGAPRCCVKKDGPSTAMACGSRTPGLIGLASMEAELSEMLRGVRVDVRTPEDLRC